MENILGIGNDLCINIVLKRGLIFHFSYLYVVSFGGYEFVCPWRSEECGCLLELWFHGVSCELLDMSAKNIVPVPARTASACKHRTISINSKGFLLLFSLFETVTYLYFFLHFPPAKHSHIPIFFKFMVSFYINCYCMYIQYLHTQTHT